MSEYSNYPYGSSSPEHREEPQTEARPTIQTPPVPGSQSSQYGQGAQPGQGTQYGQGAQYGQQPPRPDYYQPQGEKSDGSNLPEHFGQPEKPRKSHVGLKAVLAGLLGGVVGAAALTGA